jgi:hypothetical protein
MTTMTHCAHLSNLSNLPHLSNLPNLPSQQPRSLRAILPITFSVALLVVLSTVLSSVLPSAAWAQREQFGIRYELNGGRSVSTSDPQRFNGGTASSWLLSINGGFQSQLDRDGTMLLTNGFQYRYVSATVPVSAAGGTFKDATVAAHALYYDGLYLQTLSERFQLAANLRVGIFSDFQNVALNHFRVEPSAFLDYFASENLTVGLGLAYGTSNFGRLITVPLLHLYWLPSSEILVDALLPSRLDVWYYPSKQWEFGLSLALIGSQFQLGAQPAIPAAERRVATDPNNSRDISQFHFANLTIGPNIRYNIFEKTYLSLEGGYTIIRRLGFANATGRVDDDYVVSYFPAFNFNVNTFFLRAGVQIMY